jgi:quinol monooxygenase YgiN
MYAVSLRAQIKDGRIDELKEFIKNSALPTLEVPGMISIGFFNPDANTNLGMAFFNK